MLTLFMEPTLQDVVTSGTAEISLCFMRIVALLKVPALVMLTLPQPLVRCTSSLVCAS